MKNIHFEKLDKLSFFKISILFIAIASLVLSHTLLEDSPFEIIRTIAFIIPLFYFGRVFWFKHYVRWNKEMIILKFHHFVDHKIKFIDIYSLHRLKNQLKIRLSSGKVYDFSIEHIDPEDISKLNRIIIEYSNAEFNDYRENSYYEGDCCSNY